MENADETEIDSLTGLTANPFNAGDVIELSVSELYPKQYDQFKYDVQKNFLENNRNHKELFHLKAVKLIREKKYIEISTLGESRLIIEYHCVWVKE